MEYTINRCSQSAGHTDGAASLDEERQEWYDDLFIILYSRNVARHYVWWYSQKLPLELNLFDAIFRNTICVPSHFNPSTYVYLLVLILC